jgi:hypothetical protein
MYQATMHRLSFSFDRTRQALVFQGQLENGYTFEVAFPIGHVALTFDNQASELGYCGSPIMGSVDTVDGFLGAVEVMHSHEQGRRPELGSSIVERTRNMQRELIAMAKSGKYSQADILKRQQELRGGLFSKGPLDKIASGAATVASKAYTATVKKVGQQAVKYARKGVEAVGKAGVAVARSKLVGQALAGVAVAFPAVGAPALAAWGAANRAVAISDSARAGVKSAQNALRTVQRNAKALTQSNTSGARMALAGLKAVAA